MKWLGEMLHGKQRNESSTELTLRSNSGKLYHCLQESVSDDLKCRETVKSAHRGGAWEYVPTV